MLFRSVYKSGTVELQGFSNLNNECYYVDIANAGKTPFEYTISKSNEWINITRENGEVKSQDTIGISVNFEMIEQDSKGQVIIKGNGQEVTINITATLVDVSGFDEKTYVDLNDCISIDASNFASSSSGSNGEEWKVIDDYGRTGSSIKVFPTTAKFYDMNEAPYVEYKVNILKGGRYNLRTYVVPSNNVDRSVVEMKFAISIDEDQVQAMFP